MPTTPVANVNGDRQNPIPPGTFDLPDLTITTFGVVTPLPDFDQDGDVDSADSTIQFINWTGALPPGVGTSTFFSKVTQMAMATSILLTKTTFC